MDGRTPLMVSVREGHVSTAACLLNRGADLYVDQGEINLLFQSLCYINPEFLDQVISKGASLEVRNEGGSTPLLEFASQGNLKAVERLLDRRVNLQAKTKDGRTALHLAAMSNHPAIVNSLISRGAPKSAKDNLGLTPLMCGCQRGHTEVLSILLEPDVDLNAISADGETALHYAASAGHLSAANHLVSQGAHLDAKDNTGVTPLMLTIKHDHLGVLRRFLDLGSDLNARNDNDWTARHYAARLGLASVIDDMASIGAPLDAKDRKGLTPLVVSIQKSQLQVLKRLLKYGADLNARDSLGWTPLHHAAHEGFLTAADLLIARGALLEARTSKTRHTHSTPLHVCTSRECIKLLLKTGADMEALDRHGETALVMAAYKGAVDALKELLASGANIEAGETTVKRQRALHRATYYSKSQIVELLLQNGADPFAQDIDGNIPSQLGWFEGDYNQAISAEPVQAYCTRLLTCAELVGKQNRNPIEKGRRDAKKPDRQKGKSRGLLRRFVRSRPGSSQQGFNARRVEDKLRFPDLLSTTSLR